MKISELGEFKLIEKMSDKITSDTELIKGIGDDCAVIGGEDEHTLLTTDMLVSGDHFNLDWQSPWQVGWKSVVVNISDIAAMGGSPRWALVSVAFPSDLESEQVDGLYDGMLDASEKYGTQIIGGDTTHGGAMVINVAVIGYVSIDDICMRGDARIGDIIGVTGDLGKSWAGLELLRAGEEGYTDFYLEPECRAEAARDLAPHVNAMIDVSDGLASEVGHICDESGVGAEVYREAVPISDRTRGAARILDKDPLQWALSGGEDFELVFTVQEEKVSEIQDVGWTEVGRITEEGPYLVDGDGKKEPLGGGYDHFS